jgi:hypothetical protein
MAQGSADIPQVGQVDKTRRNSDIIEGPPKQSGGPAAPSGAICYFNGLQYGAGAEICSAGSRLLCGSDGN